MSDAFDELAALWARRDRLDEAGWRRLYALVMGMLASNPPAEEGKPILGGEDAQAWRDSFFCEKVVKPALIGNAAMGRELTPGGLQHFYRNYLRDQIRRAVRRPEIQGYEGAEADAADPTVAPGGDQIGPSPADAALGGPYQADCSVECELADGLDAQSLRRSARQFLQGAEEWVVIYLALHFCGGRDRLPLSEIHKQFAIPSYHHKARQLGIAPPRGGYPQFNDFSRTMIGRWLTDNGVALDLNRIEVMRQAFDWLCLEAFREARERELLDCRESAG